jgi:hypothetical protein
MGVTNPIENSNASGCSAHGLKTGTATSAPLQMLGAAYRRDQGNRCNPRTAHIGQSCKKRRNPSLEAFHEK